MIISLVCSFLAIILSVHFSQCGTVPCYYVCVRENPALDRREECHCRVCQALRKIATEESNVIWWSTTPPHNIGQTPFTWWSAAFLVSVEQQTPKKIIFTAEMKTLAAYQIHDTVHVRVTLTVHVHVGDKVVIYGQYMYCHGYSDICGHSDKGYGIEW